MSVHKLTAGSGYDYLTRQVAALDATEKGHVGLASYYTERGEAPGQWVGSGLGGLDGLTAGEAVTAQQMHALFGAGHHPLAAERLTALEAEHRDGSRPLGARDRETAARLGAPFKVYTGDVSPFRVEVARRIAAVNTGAGRPADSPVPAEERARVRTEVAREFFLTAHGRPPRDARELSAEIARQSRPRTTAVAGYDLTFSPVKSVSALWAIAPPDIAARIERAHQGAVADALRFIETHALYTRTGRNGVRQVDVTGLVGTAFTHRDSRAGDPDLHTHVAVANKVQTRQEDTPGGGGRWLSIDGRVLFKAVVTASETYNTALETRLRDDLGLQFAPREEQTRTEDRKRPVREVVGLPAVLLKAWSVRRADIDLRRGQLTARFQRDHRRPPTPVETLHLAQQANLETRAAKHEPRTLAEQRATWRAQAEDVVGSGDALQRMVAGVLRPTTTRAATHPGNPGWVEAAAARTLAALQRDRSTWQVWHVRAEAQRQVRGAGASTDASEHAVQSLVVEVLQRRSVALRTVERTSDGRPLLEPEQLRRADGTSVYRVAGRDLYTSAAVLAAEQRLVQMAGRHDGRVVSSEAVDVALLEATANGTTLNAGQVALVRQMATSGARLQLAIAPAGTGKTTAMSVLAAAWTQDGGHVIGLSPSAAAAAALREQTGTHTDTLAKLTWGLTHQHEADPGGERAPAGATHQSPVAASLPDWAQRIDASTLVVIDEAGMADTLSLRTAVDFIVGRGGSVRLVGDDQQLAAIGAGGVLRDIQATHGALHLDELLRFRDPAEAAASLALREGRPEALGFYLDADRVHVGDLTTLTEQVLNAWQTDRAAGLDSIMLAPTHHLVADLNQRARAHRLATTPTTQATPTTQSTPYSRGRHGRAVVLLADGNEASEGDLLITRRNDRRLRTSSTDWVKNGDRWTLTHTHDNGDVTARHLTSRRSVRLPADYVRASTELGYATTVHSAQGLSVDTMHGLASAGPDGHQAGRLSRQQLYTMLTRGRLANHVYLPLVGDGDPHTVLRPDVTHPRTATEHLEAILARDDTPTSASTLQREQADPATQLGHATARYLDALYLAAEDVIGADVVQDIEAAADNIVPGIEHAPAWSSLRAHLLLLAATGRDPVDALRSAAADRSLTDAHDPAAVLDWRLDDTGLRSAGAGPLPWLPAIPTRLTHDGTWGEYLTDRADQVADLAAHVRARADGVPPWLQTRGGTAPPPDVIAEVEVWRAAAQVDPGDRRPTGTPHLQKAARTWQRTLDQHVHGDQTPAWAEWGDLIQRLTPGSTDDDPFRTDLANHLAGLSKAGLDARALLVHAAAAGPLPDDHAAAALWWRIHRTITPATTDHKNTGKEKPPPWTSTPVAGPQPPQTRLDLPGGAQLDVPHRRVAPSQANERRWYAIAAASDPRLVEQDDWPALRDLMQAAAEAGHDVAEATRQLAAAAPLGDRPAQELRHRLVEDLVFSPEDPMLSMSPPPATRRVQNDDPPVAPRRSPAPRR